MVTDTAKLIGVVFENAPTSDVVHVLVKLPDDFLPNKRLRMDTVEALINVEILEDVLLIEIETGDYPYVTLPKGLLDRCGLYYSEGDLILYRRPQVQVLWDYLKAEVVEKKTRAYIVGPPGTGKSVCTLSFTASLDREEWNVVWIHLGVYAPASCLAMGTKEFWCVEDIHVSQFKLPRVADKKLFVLVDGITAVNGDKAFMKKIHSRLDPKIDRLVVPSANLSLAQTPFHFANQARLMSLIVTICCPSYQEEMQLMRLDICTHSFHRLFDRFLHFINRVIPVDLYRERAYLDTNDLTEKLQLGHLCFMRNIQGYLVSFSTQELRAINCLTAKRLTEENDTPSIRRQESPTGLHILVTRQFRDDSVGRNE